MSVSVERLFPRGFVSLFILSFCHLWSGTGGNFCHRNSVEDPICEQDIMATPTKFTVSYFEFRWLAEPIRYLLRYVGEEFEDERLNWDEWLQRTPEENAKLYSFGKLPALTERDANGKVILKLSQSFTILRYLGVKYGLVSKDAVEQARCEEVADCVKDMLKEVEQLMVETNTEERKTTVKKSLLEKTFPRYFAVINENLAEQQKRSNAAGTAFFPLVGSSITWADFILAHFTEIFQIFLLTTATTDEERNAFSTLLDKYPSIKAHQQGVFSLEQIQKWIQDRPQSDF